MGRWFSIAISCRRKFFLPVVGGINAVHHLVERVGQGIDLVLAFGFRYPGIQVFVGDLLDLYAHLVQGLEVLFTQSKR